MVSKKKSSNLITAGIVLAGITIAGVTYSLFSNRENLSIVQQASIWEASQLGNMPISHSSEKGKPIVFIGQQHPNSTLQVGALTTHKDTNITNIAEVAQAAFEAYDKYGIRALFIEGTFPLTVEDYNKNKKIRALPAHAKDTYAPIIQHILNSREWTLYSDSSEAYADLQRIHRPIRKEFRGYVQKMIDAMKRKESIEYISNLRNKCQKQMNASVKKNLETLTKLMYTNREKVVINATKEALKKEKGIVVIYGYFHAKGMQYQAKQENMPLILALNKKHSEHLETYSTEELILRGYILPKIESAK